MASILLAFIEQLLTWSRWVKRRFVWHHTIISQSPPDTYTQECTRSLDKYSTHTWTSYNHTHTASHPVSTSEVSQSVSALRLTFSHCSKALCHWGTSGVQGVIPFMINFNKQNCNSRSRSASTCSLYISQEYFCLKPESLNYWFVLLACFKAGWCWIPKKAACWQHQGDVILSL